MIVPSITSSIISISNSTRGYSNEEFIDFLNKMPFISYLVDTSSIANLLNSIEEILIEYSSNIIKYSTGIINSIGSIVKTTVIVLFAFIMSFYALKDSERIFENAEDVMRAFISENTANKITRIAKLTDQSFRKFLIGKLYTCLILGSIVTSSIVIINAVTPLHIPYALLIGVIIGVTNIIPYIGGIIGTIPCVFIVILSGYWEGLFVWIIIIIAQQIDNVIIGPKVLGDSVGLKPFWIITGITVGGSLFGAVGMILSVPIMSVILQLIAEKVDLMKQQQKSDT